MEENKQPAGTEQKALTVIDIARQKFEIACKDAASLQIINNFGAAFTAVNVVSLLREALTDEVMQKVFIPLMNTKVGFLTDRTGRRKKNGETDPPYSIDVVRDAIIDGVCIGLVPTGNQINIIAERMYPTKEGYTALLKKVGCKYFLNIGYDKGQNQTFAEIPVTINYEYKNEKKSFQITATVKKDGYSSHDQLRGKAERRAKKILYEFLTGCDFGDADDTYATYEEVPDQVKEEIAKNANGEPIKVMAQPQPQSTIQPVGEQAPPAWAGGQVDEE